MYAEADPAPEIPLGPVRNRGSVAVTRKQLDA